MSDLVVIAYEDESTAFKVREKLEGMEKAHLVGLEDLVVVVRDKEGKVKIKQAENMMGIGALSGAFWGMLIGIIFWMPFLGLAVGAISGALAGKFSDLGIDHQFVKDLAATIQTGTSAVFMLIRDATPDKFVSNLEGVQGQGHPDLSLGGGRVKAEGCLGRALDQQLTAADFFRCSFF